MDNLRDNIIVDNKQQFIQQSKKGPIHWNVTQETCEEVLIPPSDLIKYADDSQKKRDYRKAEEELESAVKNALGTGEENAVKNRVREKLIYLYIDWIGGCIAKYNFLEAEPVVDKLIVIAGKSLDVREKITEFYRLWMNCLLNEKNILGAIVICKKQLRYDIACGVDLAPVIEKLCGLLYSTNDKNDEKYADCLFAHVRKNRVNLFCSAVFLLLVGIFLPLFVPASLSILTVSFIYSMLDARRKIVVRASQKGRGIMALLFLVGFINLAVLTMILGPNNVQDSRALFGLVSIITYLIAIVISGVMFWESIKRFYILITSKDSRLLPDKHVLKCKNCHSKVEYLDGNMDAIYCDNCGMTVRSQISLNVDGQTIDRQIYYSRF